MKLALAVAMALSCLVMNKNLVAAVDNSEVLKELGVEIKNDGKQKIFPASTAVFESFFLFLLFLMFILND